MPIKIPSNLPAAQTLQEENIFVITEPRANTQDIRPLKILLLNLMPEKLTTERQLARLLGNTPIQVELELIHPSSHTSQNTSEEHLLAFYKTFAEVKANKYDGLIITGAPVENYAFEEVDYWEELCEIMEWSKTNVFSTFHICWGAQAGLYYHYGIQKRQLTQKLFGVYEHHVMDRKQRLFRGFDDNFAVPHSRHTTILREDLANIKNLSVLAASEEAGIYVVSANNGKQLFVMGHSEYEPLTLYNEFIRDKNNGLEPAIPQNYFPGNDITQPPQVKWRSHANLLYANWVNYYVYQDTPYDLNELR